MCACAFRQIHIFFLLAFCLFGSFNFIRSHRVFYFCSCRCSKQRFIKIKCIHLFDLNPTSEIMKYVKKKRTKLKTCLIFINPKTRAERERKYDLLLQNTKVHLICLHKIHFYLMQSKKKKVAIKIPSFRIWPNEFNKNSWRVTRHIHIYNPTETIIMFSYSFEK